MPHTPYRIVVLISGFGSNLQAIINQIKTGDIPAQLCAVISDQAQAYGLQRAAHAHIPAIIIEGQYKTRLDFDKALMEQIDTFKPNLVILSGFMRILSSEFVAHYKGRLINIHPSLLPKHKGLATHAKALAHGDKQHGSTVHFVTDELDNGPIIAKMIIDVDENDTEETLKARVQEKEHILYPAVIKWFAENRLHLKGKTVYLDELALPDTGAVLEIDNNAQG
jgi:phosphoribosylglycinamide formyltransferase-1